MSNKYKLLIENRQNKCYYTKYNVKDKSIAI